MTAVDYPKASELREKLVATATELRELRETPAAKRGDTFSEDVNERIRTINALDAEHKIAEMNERTTLESMAFDAAVAEAELRAKRGQNGPSAAMGNVGNGEARTLGEAVVNHAGYAEWREAGAKYGEFRIELEGGEVRTLITSATDDTPAAGVLIATAAPIPPDPRQRRFFIRDLLASGSTNLPAIPYVREVTPATNETAASAVLEGAAKPEATMQFATVTALVRKIAAWVPATEEILADAPTLASYINARLVYMVKVREEADLLYGDETGSNPTVPGILSGGASVTGVQTQSVLSSGSTPIDDIVKTLGMSIAKVELVDGYADGIAMHPTNYWEAMTQRWGDAGAGGTLDAGSPFNGPPGTIWGLPVVRTRALTVDTAVVADWRGGGQVFQRAGITVRTSDSHDDYFVKNKIAILAEERIAVAWYRPDFFVNATVD